MSDTATKGQTGAPKLLAEYDCDEGARQLIGRRVDGVVRITDRRPREGAQAWLRPDGRMVLMPMTFDAGPESVAAATAERTWAPLFGGPRIYFYRGDAIRAVDTNSSRSVGADRLERVVALLAQRGR